MFSEHHGMQLTRSGTLTRDVWANDCGALPRPVERARPRGGWLVGTCVRPGEEDLHTQPVWAGA